MHHDEMDARDDVTALLCFGSAQRGEAKPGSDLDLCAVSNGSERWTRSQMVEGVEAQLQLGPLRIWRNMVEKRHAVIVNAFATGELLFDKTGEATALKRDAEAVFHAGPQPMSALDTDRQRYGITNMVRDLEDLPEESVEARMLSGVIVVEALKAWCSIQQLWLDRKPRVMYAGLRGRDPALAERVAAFYASPSRAGSMAIADAVLGAVGGRLYEMSTPPEPA